MTENKEKEIVAWQFADELLKHINNKLNRINYYMMADMYEQAFEELRQIFIMINWEIMREYKDKYDLLIQSAKDISVKLYEYEIFATKRPSRMIMVKMSKVKAQLKDAIYEYYRELMQLMDQLNMMFPKIKQDHRLAIYK